MSAAPSSSRGASASNFSKFFGSSSGTPTPAPNRIVQDVILEEEVGSTGATGDGATGEAKNDTDYAADFSYAAEALAVDPDSRTNMETKLADIRRDIGEENVICDEMEDEIERLQQQLQLVRSQRTQCITNMEGFLQRTKGDLEGLRHEITQSESQIKELNNRNESLRVVSTL